MKGPSPEHRIVGITRKRFVLFLLSIAAMVCFFKLLASFGMSMEQLLQQQPGGHHSLQDAVTATGIILLLGPGILLTLGLLSLLSAFHSPVLVWLVTTLPVLALEYYWLRLLTSGIDRLIIHWFKLESAPVTERKPVETD